MAKIVVIYQQNHSTRQKEIEKELQKEGFEVAPVDIESTDTNALAAANADLLVVHLHPDAPATWGAYLDYKHRFPDFPVLVYMGHHPVTSLTSAIQNALGQKRGTA